jgi:hypothetical protein
MVWNFPSRNGAGGLQMRRITVNILNKKLQTKDGPSAWGLDRRLSTSL